MSIFKRLKNALKTGGLREVVRKLFWKMVYRINSQRTYKYVDKASLEYGLNTEENREQKIIISLTSFTSRLTSLHKCLKSLLVQDTKPDLILVYFGNDVTRDMLPTSLTDLEKYGIEYRFIECENLRSYKKFYYAMKEFPQEVIITVDDDVYYPRYWLTSFLKTHKSFPNCVCAWRLHKVRIENGELLPYNQWIDQYRKCKVPSFSLFPTGVGGILYPPGCLSQYVFDKETFQEMCFYCDDIWLKIMCLLNGTKTVWVPSSEVSFYEVERKQEYALINANVGAGANDKVLQRVMERFQLDYKAFCDE